MLGVLWLLLITYFGQRICQRFYRFTSIQHRLATSFLVGLLLSGWITYLGALVFASSWNPLISGNVIFLIVAGLVIYKMPRSSLPDLPLHSRSGNSERWDYALLGVFLIFACWLMFAPLNFRNGQFQISIKAWSDFGANMSLVQSFALGHNFPTQHPFFPGEMIHYHFLFWFQAANLEFLGLNPVWSVNILSILTLVALLVLIMTLGEVLFDSRAVGRIAAGLFFFTSSLSYLPFLRSQHSFAGAITSALHATDFLTSGYPFRGEGWGALSANLYAYQRHLISGIGILLATMIFAISRYRGPVDSGQESNPELNQADGLSPTNDPANGPGSASVMRIVPGDLGAFIFSGVLIGLLPYWNSPVFLAALLIFGVAFLILPCRLYTACLIGSALLVGLPQVLLLRSGNVIHPPLFHFGYTLDHPTLWLVIKYLGWTFGLKWLLIVVALVFASGFHRRLMVAVMSLLVVVFIFQLSPDIFNNHKLLNVWATIVNLYAGYALWRISRKRIVGIVVAIVLAVGVTLGGVIDLMPLHNDAAITIPYQNDRLTQWVLKYTKPSDVFLTHQLLTHPILFAGRKIFFGNTLMAWTAGYDLAPRERDYHSMFEERDFAKLTRLLDENHIAYVAIDDGVRHNNTISGLNEAVYQQHFAKVFEDTEHHYDNVTIYKVASR